MVVGWTLDARATETSPYSYEASLEFKRERDRRLDVDIASSLLYGTLGEPGLCEFVMPSLLGLTLDPCLSTFLAFRTYCRSHRQQTLNVEQRINDASQLPKIIAGNSSIVTDNSSC